MDLRSAEQVSDQRTGPVGGEACPVCIDGGLPCRAGSVDANGYGLKRAVLCAEDFCNGSRLRLCWSGCGWLLHDRRSFSSLWCSRGLRIRRGGLRCIGLRCRAAIVPSRAFGLRLGRWGRVDCGVSALASSHCQSTQRDCSPGNQVFFHVKSFGVKNLSPTLTKFPQKNKTLFYGMARFLHLFLVPTRRTS